MVSCRRQRRIEEDNPSGQRGASQQGLSYRGGGGSDRGSRDPTIYYITIYDTIYVGRETRGVTLHSHSRNTEKLAKILVSANGEGGRWVYVLYVIVHTARVEVK